MNLSSCYGPGLGDLVKLVGEVDVLDKESVAKFAADQWQRVATTLGFGEAIGPGLRASLVSKGQLGSVSGVAVRAVSEHVRTLEPESSPASFAKLRFDALNEAAGSQPGWTFEIDLTTVANAGCVDGIRSFLPVNRETYFQPARSDELTPRDCYWPTTCPMFLGTWPWVYGHNLAVEPSTLRWKRTADHDPVALAARLHGVAWSLAGNAAIDARTVYDQFNHFRTATAPLIEALPQEPQAPGSLYRSQSGLLRVYMHEVGDEVLNGILGAVSVRAYNHCLHSFAAFFRMRAAMMNNHKNLPNAIQTILDHNPDPCVESLRKPENLSL